MMISLGVPGAAKAACAPKPHEQVQVGRRTVLLSTPDALHGRTVAVVAAGRCLRLHEDRGAWIGVQPKQRVAWMRRSSLSGRTPATAVGRSWARAQAWTRSGRGASPGKTATRARTTRNPKARGGPEDAPAWPTLDVASIGEGAPEVDELLARAGAEDASRDDTAGGADGALAVTPEAAEGARRSGPRLELGVGLLGHGERLATDLPAPTTNQRISLLAPALQARLSGRAVESVGLRASLSFAYLPGLGLDIQGMEARTRATLLEGGLEAHFDLIAIPLGRRLSLSTEAAGLWTLSAFVPRAMRPALLRGHLDQGPLVGLGAVLRGLPAGLALEARLLGGVTGEHGWPSRVASGLAPTLAAELGLGGLRLGGLDFSAGYSLWHAGQRRLDATVGEETAGLLHRRCTRHLAFLRVRLLGR